MNNRGLGILERKLDHAIVVELHVHHVALNTARDAPDSPRRLKVLEQACLFRECIRLFCHLALIGKTIATLFDRGHMDRERMRKEAAQLTALHDRIDQSMLEREFSGLEPFGKRLANRIFDHAPACEPDERMWFRDDQIAFGGERCGHAARGGIGDDGKIRQPCTPVTLDRSRGLCHLHERHETFLHARAA